MSYKLIQNCSSSISAHTWAATTELIPQVQYNNNNIKIKISSQ
jgi:hypothetical protein